MSAPLSALLPDVRRLRDEGFGNVLISRMLGISRQSAWRLMKRVELEDARTGIVVNSDNVVVLYDAACQALAKARTLIEVKDIADRASALREYGRLAKDRMLEIDAAELRIRAERRLGEMLASIDLKAGRPLKNGSDAEPFRPTLAEMGIDKKLSARAQQLAKVDAPVMEERIAQWRTAAAQDERVSVNILKGGAVNGARSIMSSRQEPDDSLDYFPTPPWATRALMEHVIRDHVNRDPTYNFRVWEPACGEGHISEVLEEYSDEVYSSDIFNYGYGESPVDFLAPVHRGPRVDWIITNPPFGDKTIKFVTHAIDIARVGVAMFVRSQWAVEGIERYESIFRDRPPTLCAFFVERVNLCKGRWDPDGTTATAYCWLVWIRDLSGKWRHDDRTFRIPPGCRESLTRPDDRERFAAWSIPKAEAAE